MGLSFFIADSQEEVNKNSEYAVFSIDIAKYMYENPDQFPSDAAMFLDLNPYGDDLFEGDGIDMLKNACRAVLDTKLLDVRLDEDVNLRDFHPFAEKLLGMCEEAQVLGKGILVLGD